MALISGKFAGVPLLVGASFMAHPIYAAASETLDLPSSSTLENTALQRAILGPNALDLTAPGGCDLFISPDGQYQVDASPRLVFKPSDAFMLTARVIPEFKNKWDAGVLVLYNDAQHFAKLCFERDFQGTVRIVSVVANGRGDDANAMPVAGDGIYFRITGSTRSRSFTFYSSADGKAWFPIRSFSLEKVDALKIGFSAQAPAGPDPCRVHFREIRFEPRQPKDMWTGD